MDRQKLKLKKKKLAYRLSGYAPSSLLFRIIMISIFAILTLWFINFSVGKSDDIKNIPAFYYFITILAFVIASELQIFLDNIFEQILPVPYKLRLRLVLQIVISLFFLAMAHKFIMTTFDPAVIDKDARIGAYMGMLLGLFLVFSLTQALLIIRLTEKLLDAQKEVAEMKQEKLRIDYSALQDQLNPHFLFNNLSVLKSLIIYDKDKAITFTENFTDVYRYVLQSNKKQLVNLKDELASLESYLALHKERLGKGLNVKSTISKDAITKNIPPLTVQLIVENAIKHNIASEDSPLYIDIITEDDYVIIRNNIQARETSYSTHTGLSNLIKRYEILSDKQPVVDKDEQYFTVKIPLI